MENWHHEFSNLRAAQGTYVEVTKSFLFVSPWVIPQSTKQNEKERQLSGTPWLVLHRVSLRSTVGLPGPGPVGKCVQFTLLAEQIATQP